MLNDDDLTRELGAAFRATTADLHYTGRTRPPASRALLAAPTALVAASVVTAVSLGVVNAHPTPNDGTAAGLNVTQTHQTAPQLITAHIQLASYTFTYQRFAGEPDPLRVVTDVPSVPNGASPISLPDVMPGVQAWVGTDPATGDNAVYLRSPIRFNGELFGLLSSTWTKDQLVNLVRGDD